jgi:hypothetical protein
MMLAAAMLAATPLSAQPPAATIPPTGDLTPPDYADPATWLCRPGVDDGSCSTNLDAIAIDAGGARTSAPYKPDPNPPIDCFYIYPTVSQDPTLFSDMQAGPEERRTVHSQAARLGSVCRLFAPIYHQFTMTALHWSLAHPGGDGPGFDEPYKDVVAAWRSYLARDNHGRGVVLVGHSQGAILLKRLIAEEIDGKPAQKHLVAAYLAGNLNLTTKSFHAIPPCASPGQTGCVVAWSSYLDGRTDGHRFGLATPPASALCVDPAAPGGDRGLLKTFLPKPSFAAASDPPYIEAIGQLSAECLTDAAGTVLRIHIEPGPNADLLALALNRAGPAPGWGLHPLDISLVQGNMLEMIASQSAAWRK